MLHLFEMIVYAFPVKLPSVDVTDDKTTLVQLCAIQHHKFRNASVLIKLEVISWTNGDQVMWPHLSTMNYQKVHMNSLTHLPLDKMVATLQMIFSNAFSLIKSFAFCLKFT